MIRLFIFASLILTGCDTADFGSASEQSRGALGKPCKPSNPECKNPPPTPPPEKTKDEIPPANPEKELGTDDGGESSTNNGSGLSTTDGGKKLVNEAKISVNTWFDGITILTINLKTGNFRYTNQGKYALSQLKIVTKNQKGETTETSVSLNSAATIPNWREAKHATPSGYSTFDSTDSKRKMNNAPGVSFNIQGSAQGKILTIQIDDDMGERAGAVRFPNFDLGLQY